MGKVQFFGTGNRNKRPASGRRQNMLAGLAAGTLLAFSSSMTVAADLPTPDYIPPPDAPAVFSWSGFYLGLHAGANINLEDRRGCDWVSDFIPGFAEQVVAVVAANHVGDVDRPPETPLSACTFGDTGSGPNGRVNVLFQTFGDDNSIVFYDPPREDVGFLGGGQVGINWQTGMWVLGVEGDIAYVGDSDRGFTFELLDDQNEEEVHVVPGRISGGDMDWLATIRGRVGGAFGTEGRTLLYATGGLALAGVEPLSGELFSANPGDFGFEGQDNDDLKIGFVVGAGVERALTDRVSVGVEALYAGFDDASTIHLGCREPEDGPDCNDEGQFFFEGPDLDSVIARAKLNWRLGG